jgi:hypothetical protein
MTAVKVISERPVLAADSTDRRNTFEVPDLFGLLGTLAITNQGKLDSVIF